MTKTDSRLGSADPLEAVVASQYGVLSYHYCDTTIIHRGRHSWGQSRGSLRIVEDDLHVNWLTRMAAK